MGFKLVPLDELGKSPIIPWSEIYDNPDFWSIEKIREYADKFYNIATTFGKSHVKDVQGIELYLHCLDIDSNEVFNKVQPLLEQEWKLKTFVTKTQKDCGYHVYWFEYSSENVPIVTEDCRKGYEFEIKCGKSLCTLPPSQHRDNPMFYYESVGQQDKIMISDGLYERLVNDILKDCLKRKKKDPKLKKRNISKDTNNKCASKSSITSKEEEDEVRGFVTPPNDKLDHYITNSSAAISKEIVLTDEQIQMSTQYILSYYHEGSRDKFVFGFSGLTYKENIAEESVAKVIESICFVTNDLYLTERLDTLHSTYVNGAQNGSDAITGKTKLKEVIMHVSNCDDKAAENIIQSLLKIWHGDNYKDKKHTDHSNNENNKNDDNNNKQYYSSTAESPLLDGLLAADIYNPAEYVINTINKTVKLDDSLVRAVFYAGCSTWTFDPMNLVISAPTSEGKTYTVLETLQYFPSKDIRKIGSMSPKVIIRQDSVLVNADTLKPVKEDIVTLQKQIKKEEDDEKRKQELEEQLEDLRANARPFIDLRGKIYVFLEPPSPDLWNIIKPIMSHDNFIIEHPYVESFQGIHVKSIITLGFPTFIFCTAKDESKWAQWDEIVSRSIVLSPNMSSKKYREATILNAQLIGLPTAMQESLIVSRREMELARKCVLYLREFINKSATIHNTNYSENINDIKYDNPVWIPYAEILGKTLPADKGTEMRINRRLMLLLKIIALAKADQRYQVILDKQTLTIASVEDLTEALYIMQNSSGLPPYKVKFFNEYIYPLYQKKLKEKLREEKQQDDIAIIESEKGEQIRLLPTQNYKDVNTSLPSPSGNSVTLTANEICDYYKLQNPKSPINSDNLRKTYLNELNYAGYIEALDVRDGNTKKVYYPIVAPAEEAIHKGATKENKESDNIPQFYTYYKINVPINYIPESEDWLIVQIMRIWKCGIDIGKGRYSIDNYNSAIQFLDISKKDDRIEDNNSTSTNGISSNTNRIRNKITMRQFAEKYNNIATETLSRHFSKPIFSNYHNKIFGNLQYIGIRQNIIGENSGTSLDSSDSSVC
jgi:hypothetical protein